MWLAGGALQEMDEDGKPKKSDSVLLLINAHYEDVEMVLPASGNGGWRFCLATAELDADKDEPDKARLLMPSRSLAVFTAAA
jgi:glycogen operon protein